MRRRHLIWCLVGSFAAGALLVRLAGWGDPVATVQIHNESGLEIASLRLSHRDGVMELAPLPAGASRTLHYYVAGESYARIELIFADGRRLHDDGHYVEPGYTLDTRIGAHDIRSRYASLPIF